MKLTTLLCVCISFALVSCGPPDPNKQVDEGKVKGEVYHSTEIGWTITIPPGYTVITKDKLEENDKKGMEAIKQVNKDSIDVSQLKHLISFQKDRFNLLASTSEPFKEDYPGQYAAHNIGLDKLIYETIVNQGIKTDSSSETVMVQGIPFHLFTTTLYTADGSVLLKQLLYSTLINGYDFGVNINYTGDDAKKVMMAAFMNSKFDKK
jgi:hypothetical protein